MRDTNHLPIPMIVSTGLLLMVVLTQTSPFVCIMAGLLAFCTIWSFSHSIELVKALEAVKTREGMLTHRASHDPLTGALNRMGYAELVAGKASAGISYGLILVDLDGFKLVNDTLGHAAGDEILLETAKRLDMITRSTDTVARLGGDEFVLIVPPDAIEVIAQRVVEQCHCLKAGQTDTCVSVSVGGAVYPADGSMATPSDVLAWADAALYAAKNRGKNCYVLNQVA